ncbi:MAG: glycoside hydrolase family 88 protein [Austwickia sp.]|nr:MAG: glycoside hydrolase family 88 protein [Austwickia sp.]
MASADTDNARLAAPPRPPVAAERLSRAALTAQADEVAAATWGLGLRRWFWGEGVCLLGLVQAARAAGRPVPGEVLRWYDERLGSPGADPSRTLDHVNEVAPGTVAVALVEDAAAARTAYLPALRRLVDWTRGPGVTRDATGAIEHWPGGVWADTMYMCGVFVARLGAHLEDADLAAEGVRQVTSHARVLQAENGLFAHGSHRGETIPCFWGRANAWAALAHVEVLEAAAAHPGLGLDVGAVADGLRRQLAALAAHQPEHGVWDVLVDGQEENRGVLETSAAAGLVAAFLRGADLLAEPALAEPGWRAVRGVLAYVDAGLLTRVSAGTVLQLVPFGYSVIRDDRPQPWGQGLLLTALAAAIERAGP